MKKLNLIITLLFCYAICSFAQNPNANTTYGGVVLDGAPGGSFIGDIDALGTLPNAYNTGFGRDVFGVTPFTLSNAPILYNTAIGAQSMYSIANGTVGAAGNTAIGVNSMYYLTEGYQNTASGMNALLNLTTGVNNCAYGYNALYATVSGSNNCAFGVGALVSNVGDNNVAVGFQSQRLMASAAYDNTSIGYQAFYNQGYGSQYNVAVGEQALYNPNNGGFIFATAVGYQALYNNQANLNTAVGYQALYGNNNGTYNVAIGDQALLNSDANDNVAIGHNALQTSVTGIHNVAVGSATLLSNTADNNTAVGYEALFSNGAGTHNNAIGDGCLHNNITGGSNVANGPNAMHNNTGGSRNTAMGDSALFNDTNSNNSGFGYMAIGLNVTGTDNTGSGYKALLNTTASYNTGIGSGALNTNQTGTYNSALGYGADVQIAGETYATAIGAQAIAGTDNTIILGNNSAKVGIGMSNFNPVAPGNKLEISVYSNPSNPTPCASPIPSSTFTVTACGNTTATGSSGLQFRDLTDASTPYPYQNNNGYLSLDDLGNVVYMAAPSVSGVFGSCSTPTTLSNDAAINMNNNNFYFDGNGNGTGSNNVMIGATSCPYSPILGKLHVLQGSGSQTGSTGIYVENDDVTSQCTATTPSIGIKAVANYTTLAPGGNPSIAGWFESSCANPALSNYAIYVPNTGGIVSIGYGSPACPNGFIGQPGGASYALQVATDIYANSIVVPSDRRFKRDFSPLKNALDKIEHLNAYYYYFDTVQFADREFTSKKQLGFIAQEVDSVLPEVVRHNTDGFLAMDYARVSVLLLQGEKELKAKTDSLRGLKQSLDSMRGELNSIQACLNKICGNSTGIIESNNTNASQNEQTVSLSSAAILYQNAPNPFGSGGSKINYFLPEGTTGASIVFFDSYGNKLKEVQLTQAGMGTIDINPVQLSVGMYTYSLVISGNIVDTKKMVFTK